MTLAPPTLRTAPVPPKARFTPQQYFYLSDHNMLGEGRTELIDGEIVRMCSQYDLHAWAVTQTADWLRDTFPKAKFWVRVQMTLHCGDDVPEPDLAVINGPAKAAHSVMTADRAKLVIEIADSTVRADTRVKPRIYAAVGIPEYWVLNIRSRKMIVHRHPERTGDQWKYAAVTQHDAGEKVSCLASPRRKLLVSDLLP